MKTRVSLYKMTFILSVWISFNCSYKRDGDNIFGKYYIKKIGDFRPSLNYKIDTSEVHFIKPIVQSYTYEVLWNDKFILVKQHPEYAAKNQAYECIRSRFWNDTVKNMHTVVRNDLSLDTPFNKTIDSIAQIEFQKRLENGDLNFIKNTKQEDITFYYLIDIKNNPEEPAVFFNKDSLNFSLEKLHIGKLTNKRTY